MAIKTVKLQGGILRYCVQIQKKGYPFVSKTFPILSDAEKWETVMTADMIRGTWLPTKEAERTTLTEALERYLKEVTPTKKGSKRETDRIKRWIDNPLATRTLAQIRSKDVAEFRDAERKRGLAENSVRLEIALLSHVFETARKEWGMESLSNPCRSIKLPAGANKRDRRLESEEEKYLLIALREGRNNYATPCVQFAIETAMRQSEILGLEWDKADLKKRIAVLENTKNGEQRIVPLSPKAIKLIKALPRPIDGGKIFRMTQDGLIRAFARACERGRRLYKEEGREPPAGFLGDLRFHDLRHEATSRLFESGKFDIMEVATITGHKTLVMLKRYTHLRAEDLARKMR